MIVHPLLAAPPLHVPSRKGSGKSTLGRRSLGRVLLVAGAASILPGPAARADISPASDLVVYCDPALHAAMEDVGRLFTARSGTRVDVFCAAPALMLAQLERVVQNDILI